MRILKIAVIGLLGIAVPAYAGDTVTYTYDALGRLVQVNHSGTANGSAQSIYNHDKADNRTSVVVTGTNRKPPATVASPIAPVTTGSDDGA